MLVTNKHIRGLAWQGGYAVMLLLFGNYRVQHIPRI